jgi:integrative and conjugative element protein (TIGR02256 family)
VGRAKTDVIGEFIRSNYPHVHVAARNHRIGGVGDLAVFAELLDDADLIIDATVEDGIHHAIAQYAAETKNHVLLVAATNGGYRGKIARSSDHGWWLCLEYAIAEGRVIQPEALPDSQLVQPAGCANPTYIGGSFDLAEISLAGVRLAVSTLCKLADPEYPDFEWDVAVVNLGSPEGRASRRPGRRTGSRRATAATYVDPRRCDLDLDGRGASRLNSLAEDQFPHETGGVLLGYASDDAVVVQQLVGPGPLATHSRMSFSPDHEYHEHRVAEEYRRSHGVTTYLGDWHSHPSGAQRLSKRDKRTLKRIATFQAARIPNPVMLITAGPPWSIDVWRLRATWFTTLRRLTVQLFDDSQG